VREVTGDFEVHITVDVGLADELASFAASRGVRFVHILLDRGVHASQPMLTVTGSGSPDDQRALLRSWEHDLRTAGIPPCRSKIEATPWAAGVPRSDDEAAGEPANRYFEHHLKLLLPASVDLAAITDLVEPHAARLSRNARRQRADGRAERFVTQRCHRVGLGTARQRLDTLVDALRSAGHQILGVEQEYVVFDSHLRLDLGWLGAPAAAGTDDPAVR
jgi:hypothetical protein